MTTSQGFEPKSRRWWLFNLALSAWLAVLAGLFLRDVVAGDVEVIGLIIGVACLLGLADTVVEIVSWIVFRRDISFGTRLIGAIWGRLAGHGRAVPGGGSDDR